MKLILLILTLCIISFFSNRCTTCLWELDYNEQCFNCGIQSERSSNNQSSVSLFSMDDSDHDSADDYADETLGGFIVPDDEVILDNNSDTDNNMFIISGP